MEPWTKGDLSGWWGVDLGGQVLHRLNKERAQEWLRRKVMGDF